MNKIRYLKGIIRRIKKVGILNVLDELFVYYDRYSKLPLTVSKSVSFKYKIYVVYSYIKLSYYLHDREQNDILDFVPRRIQTYLLPIINPLDKKDVLVNKLKFYRILNENNLPYPEVYFYVNNKKAYDFYGRELSSLSDFNSREIFVKVINGSSGKGAEIIRFSEINPELKDNCIYQERLYSHGLLKELADVESFNTCRVSSYIDNDKIISIDLAYLKLGGKGNVVDNIASGGVGIPIDIKSGELGQSGFVEFGNKFELDKHPFGKRKFKGFVVPEWESIKNTVIKAHNLFSDLRHISWDIGITDRGPVIVEGNSGGDIFANQLVGDKRYYHHKLISDTLSKQVQR